MPHHWTEYPYPHYYWLNFGPHYRSASRPDDEIAKDLSNRLAADSWVNPEHIQVAVHQGIVTLTGQVGSIMEKRAAGDDAWDTPGVHDVQNDLMITQADRPSPQ